MERDHEPRPVLCVACRHAYVPRNLVGGGCPKCGCVSWIAARLLSEPADTRAAATPG
jgi:hypothetical protein